MKIKIFKNDLWWGCRGEGMGKLGCAGAGAGCIGSGSRRDEVGSGIRGGVSGIPRGSNGPQWKGLFEGQFCPL